MRGTRTALLSASTGGRPVYPRVSCDWYRPGRVPYTQAWHWQQQLLKNRIERPNTEADQLRDVVFFVEHPHVYTLGRGASRSQLLFEPADGSVDAEIHTVERGGKITYHGPGQLVVYPVFNLAHFHKDLHWYVRTIEEVIILSLRHFGIPADRSVGYPGVWVEDRKVAQVGMNCSKWVTSHGLAINVAPNMTYFKHIVPCGIDDRPVTSMADELGRPITVAEVEPVVAQHFQQEFNVDLVPADGNPLSADARAVGVSAPS